MHWDEYKWEALKTAPDHEAPEDRMMQAIIGLTGEAWEMKEAPSIPEAGDVCWYYALLVDAVDRMEPDRPTPYIPGGVRTVEPDADMLLHYVCQLADEAEKVLFQGGDIHLTHLVKDVGQVIRDVIAYDGYPLDVVFKRNIAKLRDRHGQQWEVMVEQKRGGA
jgi:hypothetical protein